MQALACIGGAHSLTRIADLPDETLQHIFSFLTCAWRAAGPLAVCTRWRRIVLDPASPWRGQCTKFYTRRRARRCATAARHGHLTCLVEMHERGYAWRANVCANAARGGHLDCLRYAHENGCDWDERTCAEAASGGHLACLIYARENGCPWDQRVPANAAAGGYIACLRYAIGGGRPAGARAACKAIAGGYLDCLIYLHENGCRWNPDLFYEAIICDQLACLTYMCETPNPWIDAMRNEVIYRRRYDPRWWTDKNTVSAILDHPTSSCAAYLRAYLS
nr:Ankyrin repeat domain containing protein [Pandoravirus aubagnensis]